MARDLLPDLQSGKRKKHDDFQSLPLLPAPHPQIARDGRMNEVKNKRTRGNVSRMCMPFV